MALRTLLFISFLAIFTVVYAQEPPGFIPLAEKHHQYPNELPLKVDTDNYGRGGQHGVNQCGPQTEGQDSVCQIAFLNSLDDFCLWGPPNPDSTIGDTEGEAVAWCTKPGRGTRVIPPGALTGVQFMRTPDYIQVVGTIDQTKINILAGDPGGEMDPHGADRRGNPLGGLFYSNGFPSSNGNPDNYQQVIEWHNFMGSDTFCLKACDPAGPSAARFCEHRFDRIGCSYNAPSKGFDQIQGTFETCKGDNQDFPGVYFVDGKEVHYEQPPEALGPINSMPYEARVPASSDCVAQPSAALYAGTVSIPTGIPTPGTSSNATAAQSTSPSGASASATKTPSASGEPTTSLSSTAASGSGTASSTGTSGGPAISLVSSALAAMFGLVFFALNIHTATSP
ncbi:hypothetical protein FB451DRAFT_1212411 [Mycena latifolia]|nr:hypothetical protein FB451DRAFT_1212411 [Mycena latifolia]